MIIPVRCFTCGGVLADKYEYYVKRCKELEIKEKKEKDVNGEDSDKSVKLNKQHFDKTVRQTVFDEIGVDRICCRRMLLGHVDLIEII